MDEVCLRFIEKSDLPYVQDYVSRREVSATTNIPYPYPENGANQWYEFISQKREEGVLYAFAILFHGEFAGSVSVRRRKEDGMGAIDYWVAPPFWRKGIGTKAVSEAIKYGFDELDITMFETFCLADNIGSCKVLEHNGFRLNKEFMIGSGYKHEGQLAKLYQLKR